MRKNVIRSIVSAFAIAVAAIGPGTQAAHAADAVPDPVINKAVFNDPFGTRAQQHALFIQLAGLIDRVPAGETIQMSFFHWDYPTTDTAEQPDLVNRLIEAHQRGARVQIIVDHNITQKQTYTRLSAVLGVDDTARSFIVACGQNRGCIGSRAIDYASGPVYAYNHNKFLTASRIVRNDGSAVSNVVYQASGNLGRWDAVESYNNGVTWTDAATYNAYSKYFADLRDIRKTSGNNNYYWVTPTGTDYKVHFFPRRERSGQPVGDPATDTVVSILNAVRGCSYDDNGVRRQTDVRVAMLVFNRSEVAKRLAALAAAGCWVDVVISDINASSLTALGDKVQITRCNVDNGWDPDHPTSKIDVRLHSKYMLIDGAYDDDIVPRVFTGSHNYAVSALRQADETLVRIMGRDMHQDYLRNFWKLRDKCRAAPGGIIR